MQQVLNQKFSPSSSQPLYNNKFRAGARFWIIILLNGSSRPALGEMKMCFHYLYFPFHCHVLWYVTYIHGAEQ
jgi:hypothetical protein